MDLDRSLLKEFAKVVNDVGDKPEPKQYVYGTVTTGAGNTKCVMLDGSDTMTPISEVVNAEAGDRVLVSVSNHQATVIGNITFPPSARKEDQAIESANGALNQSNQAMEKAKDAQTKASSAITDSSVASALANEAKTESAKAQEAANTAIQNAGEAKQLAQASSNKSDETQQLANQVKDSVTAANKDIGKLKTEVKTANDNIASANTKLEEQASEITTIKETYSTKVETESTKADLTTEISKKVGELQTSVEKNFATKTENVALEKKLQTQITQNADSISSTVTKVEKLQSDTTEQQKNIDKALQDAQAANTAAGVAKSDAEKAKTAADTAQKAANDATAKAESATTAANLAEQKVTAADKQLQSAKTDLKEAQENLKNVTSRVDATEQEITDAKQKVDTANANVTKALKDVAEANAAASKANEVASKAQGEATAANKAASDAQTKAADAQKIATNAQQAADKAQKDLAALTNRVTTAETSIKQTKDDITAQATKITETSNKIDNLKIDGRNLTLKTGTEIVLYSFNNENYYSPIGYPINSKYGIDRIHEGGKFTVSFDWESLNVVDAYTMYVALKFTSVSYSEIKLDAASIPAGNNSGHVSFSFEPTKEMMKYGEAFLFGSSTTNVRPSGNLKISNFKLEIGNEATDWTPAPEDLSDYYNKTQTDAQIKISADKITQSVSETYETKTGVSSKIDNLQVGGRNLFLETKNKVIYDGCNSQTINGFQTIYYSYFESFSDIHPIQSEDLIPKVGQTYTIQMMARARIYSDYVYDKNKYNLNHINLFDIKTVNYATADGIYNTNNNPKLLVSAYTASNPDALDGFKDGTVHKVGSIERIIIRYNDELYDAYMYIILANGKSCRCYYPFVGKQNSGAIQQFWYPNVWGNGVSDSRFLLHISEEWKKYSHSWTVFNGLDSETKHSMILARLEQGVGIGTIEVYAPKFEIGNKATDWTPAPEDQEQYVNNKIAASEKTTEESYTALINQTAKDINVLVQNIQKETSSNSTSISEMSTNFKVTADGLSATKSAIQTLTNAVNGTISKEELQQYIRWNGGDLELGNSVQPFRCKLSNTELAFYQNNDKVAWISNKELYILKAIIAQSIGCGNFLFVDEGDLGFSLI